MAYANNSKHNKHHLSISHYGNTDLLLGSGFLVGSIFSHGANFLSNFAIYLNSHHTKDSLVKLAKKTSGTLRQCCGNTDIRHRDP